MIRHGEAPYLECSSRGDKRFSAFYARVNGASIERTYQAAKILTIAGQRSAGWSINVAKGRRAENDAEVRKLYGALWDQYIRENPALLEVLKAASGLSDVFGSPGSVCQATELWRIRNAPCDLCSSFDFRCTGACRDPGRPVPNHGSGPGGPAWEPPQ